MYKRRVFSFVRIMMFLLALLAVSVTVSATQVGPVGKVLSLLSNLKSEIQDEQKAEQANFEDFSDWCSKVSIEKKHAIADGEKDIDRYNAVIEKNAATVEAEASKIEEAVSAIAARESDLGKAIDIRKKENADFVSRDNELSSTIDMLVRAKRILKKNLSLVQKGSMDEVTDTLNELVNSSMVPLQDKRTLSSFLQDKDDVYESKSGGIVDTLEDLREKAVASKNESQKEEMTAEFNFKMLKQSLENEIKSLQESLAASKNNQNAASEEKAEAEGDLSVSKKAVAADKDSLASAHRECLSGAKNFEIETKSRNAEVAVIDKAVEILNSAGNAVSFFVQVKEIRPSQERAAKFLKALADKMKSAALAQVSMRVSQGPFGKVKQMIRDMVDKLTKEQANEASHKAWCDEELAVTRKALGKKNAQADRLKTKIAKAETTQAKLGQRVSELTNELSEMNDAERKAIEIRGEQKSEYKKIKSDLEQGLSAVTNAIEVLNDFYSSEASASSTGGKGASSGIIGMLQTVEADLSTSLAESNAGEAEAVEKFEKMIQSNKVDRAVKQTDIKGKEAEINRLKTAKNENQTDLNDVEATIPPLDEYLAGVTEECTAKAPTFEERQARRKNKIEGLKTALEILESETASFLQRSLRGH